jgi:Fur family ferric uptake transcriptional regulator
VDSLNAVEVSTTPKEKFREYLETKKMRLTPERERIVDEVFESHEHFDVEQLVARLTIKSTQNRVSRATVYRTIQSLEEAGMLRKVARNNDREIYEHDYGYPQHDHLVCKKCGKLEEFQSDEIQSIIKQIADKRLFLMDGHRLEVYGICIDCRKQPVRRPRKLDML